MPFLVGIAISAITGALAGILASTFLPPFWAGIVGGASFGLCAIYISSSQLSSQLSQEEERRERERWE